MGEILKKANIWDLHIHTPLGTPTKRNYGNDTNEQFVEKILEIYEKSSNKIGMISFTDHNAINVEAYEYFMKKSSIKILPGIEVDIFLSERDKDSKHIIFYFDEQELKDLSKLKILIEDYLNNTEKVIFEDFIMHLLVNKKNFAVSPHAFKQGKRGIDYDWFDEQSATRGTNEFTGLFFSFWEAAGKTDICKAIEFLNNQYQKDENKQAIIAFSDSADYKKIQSYIDNPHQYFNCLNSFKGLLLAGSDSDRIIYEDEERPKTKPSEKISRVIFSDDLKKTNKKNTVEIELSDRLNVIVGGRGKGKSALLDAIVASIDGNSIEERERRDFVKKFHLEAKNFNESIMSSNVSFLYFSQSYIGKLFDGKSQTKLETFFQKEFAHNSKITNSTTDLHAKLDRGEETEVLTDINVADDLINLKYIKDETPTLKISGKREKSISFNSEDGENYKDLLKQILPKESKLWNEELNQALDNLIRILLIRIGTANYKQMMDIKFANMLKKKIDEKKKNKDKENKKKLESKSNIETKLRGLYSNELELIRQVNKLYEVKETATKLKMKYFEANGEGNNKFYFVSISNREHPVEFAKRIIIDSVNKAIERKFDKLSNEEIFIKYATSRDLREKLKDSISFEEVVENINQLKGLYSQKIQKILYLHDNEFTDLHKSSPGTQTNAIMEYILHSNSTIPLFIDQPEDNIDNEARYSQLTKWIRTQKYNRQIILVTHDANIVINGDAENVIIAEHTEDKFKYEYGALEYGEILDKAAVILDGGKTAIHRRIQKYGE